jgi:flagellar biosynthesis chaperone FliJ
MARNKKYNENYNKILEAVLLDEELMEYAQYEPSEISSLECALSSKNAIVSAVATIVEGLSEDYSEKEIYNTVNDLLKKKL